MRPIAVDLFAGCGGMSLGLEASGFDIALSVEIDPIHSLVHHYNFPYGKTLCKNISTLTSNDIISGLRNAGYTNDIDIIVGGPPCQGFSHIGKRQLDDPRNSLVFDYLRIIKELKPKYFIFENVPGIASGKHKQFLEELIAEFKALGYNLAHPYNILDASRFGAAQKRRRLILIGSREDVSRANYPLETHSDTTLQNNNLFGCYEKNLSTVEQAIGDLEEIPAFLGQDPGVSNNQLDYSNYRENFSLFPKGFYELCHQRSVPNKVFGHIGSVHTKQTIKKFASTEPGTTEPTSRFFKVNRNGQCNTLRAGTASDKGAYTAPRPIHYNIPRCITVREAARLHSFPDWFRFHNTIWHGFREIGNAVIPQFAKALGDEVIKVMGIDTSELPRYDLPEVDDRILSFGMNEASDYWQVPHDVIPKRKRLVNA